MKALTCSQCGAAVKDISRGQKFVRCSYCDSKILLFREKAAETTESGEELTPYQKYLKKREENSRKYASFQASHYSADDSDDAGVLKLIGFIVAIIAGFVLFLTLKDSLLSN